MKGINNIEQFNEVSCGDCTKSRKQECNGCCTTEIEFRKLPDVITIEAHEKFINEERIRIIRSFEKYILNYDPAYLIFNEIKFKEEIMGKIEAPKKVIVYEDKNDNEEHSSLVWERR